MRTLFSTPIRTLGRLMLVGLLSGLFIACDDSSSSLPEVPEMSISDEPLFFSEAGGELCISFTTNRPWTARLVGNLDALGTQNSCTAEVTLPEKPEVGNFEAVWDMNTAKGDTSTTVSANTLPAIAVGDLMLTADATNISATKWAFKAKSRLAIYGNAE